MKCTKRRHTTRSAAERALQQRKRIIPGGYPGRVYRCVECGLFHIGRKRKDARKDRQK